MKNLNALDVIALVLAIIGGLNLGLEGLFGLNVIDSIFGVMSIITRIIYILIGLAAIYLIIVSFSFTKK